MLAIMYDDFVFALQVGSKTSLDEVKFPASLATNSLHQTCQVANNVLLPNSVWLEDLRQV